MLQLTRDGEYGVRAVLHLSTDPMRFSDIKEISAAQDVPGNYLAKIMQQLAKSGLVRSRRGAKGGYALARPPRVITLREVIEAVEGPIFLNVCLIKKGECPRDAICPVHDVWREAQKKLFEVLDSRTMEDLVRAGIKKSGRAKSGPGGGKRLIDKTINKTINRKERVCLMESADVVKKKELKEAGVNKVTFIKTEQLGTDAYYFKAGQVLAYHRHPEGDQIFFVHEGKGKFYLDNGKEESLELRPGVCVLAPKGVWHKIVADGELVVSQVTRQPAGMETR